MLKYIKKRMPVMVIGMLIGAMFACSKMDATYRDFLKDGERIYIGKADSVRVRSGNNRVQLEWLPGSDPKVSAAKIYWNNRAYSQDVSMNSATDTVKVIVNNLIEGDYSFEIVQYDDQGNFSMPNSGAGKSYGETYAALLINRPISDQVFSNGDVRISWGGAMVGTIGVEIVYNNTAGEVRSVKVPADETETLLAQFKPGETFRYRTLYLPDSLALDTFYTSFREQEVYVAPPEEVQLDKSKFALVTLPGDTWQPNVAVRTVDKIWDSVAGTAAGNSFNGLRNAGFPQHFTFDLGIRASLSRLIYYPKAVAGDSFTNTPRVFEIWGSNDPAGDGSWDSWTKLLECEYVKPSGLPGSEHTADDRTYSLAGIDFHFPQQTPPFRYIRFRTMEIWSGDNVVIQEITLYGYPQE